MKRFSVVLLLSLFVVFSLIIMGCGSATDDLAGSAVVSTNNVVTLVGYVRDGSQSSFRTAAEMRCSLGSLAGIKVFLEKFSSLYGVTDANGKYVIQNVPQGIHTLIAEKREGTQVAFRARQENVIVSAPTGSLQVELSSQDSSQIISMQASPYSLTLFITDTNNMPLYRAKATIWGNEYYSDASGSVYLSDFPGTDTEAVISMVGYKTITVPVSFGDNYNSEIFVQLPQNAETNSAPIVSITYNPNSSAVFKSNDILYIRPNERLELIAKGFDADNDYINYQWSAVGGYFSGNTTGYNATFIAAASSSRAIVVLVGRDSKNGIGKAELELNVYGGSAPIATDTPTPYNPPATSTPDPYNPPPATSTPDPYNPPPATSTPDPYNPPPATDTPIIATDTPIIATDTPIIATDTPIIATDTPDIGSGTPDIGSGTPDIGSGTPDIGSGTPDIGSGTPDIGSGTPDIGSGTPDIGSGTPDIGSGTPDIGSGTPDIGSGTPDIGSGSQDIGSGSPRI